jgi:hypothetical protein
MKMRSSIFLMAIVVLSITAILGYSKLNPDSRGNHIVKDYMKEKYGVNSQIKEQRGDAGIENSEVEYVVFPTNNEEVLFTVTVDYVSDPPKIKDTYNQALATNKEYQKFKKVIPAIKDLGFQGRYSSEMLLDYTSKNVEGEWKNYITLPLKVRSAIDITTFEEQELDGYYKLVKIIQNSNAAINQVAVEDTRDTTVSKTIVIKMDQLKDVTSKEGFLSQLIRTNWELASLYANKKWEKEAKNIENERFRFGTEYDDYWFNCLVTNEKGECTSILATVTYQEGGLKQSNPYLLEDLNTIFHFFDKTMKPKPILELSLQEGGQSNEMVRFTQAERSQYKTTEDLIKRLFKKQ